MFYATDALHWEGKSRVMIFQPGNLPVVWYRSHSGSRVIGRTVLCNASKLHIFLCADLFVYIIFDDYSVLNY